MSINQSPSKAVAQFASGLFGYAVGAPTNDAVLAQAALTGLNPIYNSFYAQNLSSLSAESVARLLVSNVGIVAGQNGLTAPQVTEAINYVKGQLSAAAATGTQGQVAASLLVGFSNMGADPVFGAAARAWNTQVDRDMAYTASGATIDVPVALAIVTPVTPATYAVSVDKTSINEGETATYTVTTTGVDAGTTLYYTLSGTGNAAASNQVGTVTINQAGTASLIVPTVNDTIVGNNGQLSFKLSGNVAAAATPAVVVAVASEDQVVEPTPVTYAIAASQSSINEGASVTYTVTTTGVNPGTKVYYSVSGTGNAAASTQVGSLTLDELGTASVVVPTVNDTTVGNGGQLTFALSGSLAATAAPHAVVTVVSEDQAATPTYAVSSVSTVNEGASLVYNIHTTGVEAGTSLHYAIGGTGSLEAGSLSSGNVTIDTFGNATVTVTTLNNDVADADKTLNFTLTKLDSTTYTAPAVTVVDNGDNNVRTLTVDDDNFDYHNSNQDFTFNATVGYYDSETTLTPGDTIIGGSGTDTLHIDVVSRDAYFWELNGNEPALQSIENVVIDMTEHSVNDNDGWGEDGKFSVWDDGDAWDVSAISAEYYDTERAYDQHGDLVNEGSLEKLTLLDLGNDNSEDGEFEDVYLHKDMTLEFVGNNVADQSGELDEVVLLGEDVTSVNVELVNVGGDYGAYANEAHLTFSQNAWNNPEHIADITISGTLTHTADVGGGSFVNDHNDAAFVLAGEDFYSSDGPFSDNFDSVTPDTITISFAATDDVTNIGVGFDSLFFGSGGYNNSVLEDASLIDFSASTANITSYVAADQFNDGSYDASEVTIKDGLGDDVLTLDVGDGGRTAITLDLGTSAADVNTVVLTNWNYTNFNGSSGGNGNIDLDDTISERFSDQDLTEDLIIIDNFNIKSGVNDTSYDELYMPTIIMAGEDNSSGGEFGWDGHFAGVEAPFVLRTENEYTEAAQAAADEASTGNKFFAAVDAVAELLLSNTDSDYNTPSIDTSDLLTNYAAAFEYEGDMYIYVDANRIYDETFDFGNWDSDYENLGLSNGDILIKLTGITSVADVVSNDQYPLFP